MDTLEESVVSYDAVRRRCREFECGRRFCENEDAGGTSPTVAIQDSIQNA